MYHVLFPLCNSSDRECMPDSKVHGSNMGPIWVLSAPDGPMLASWTLLSEVLTVRVAVTDFFSGTQDTFVVRCKGRGAAVTAVFLADAWAVLERLEVPFAGHFIETITHPLLDWNGKHHTSLQGRHMGIMSSQITGISTVCSTKSRSG